MLARVPRSALACAMPTLHDAAARAGLRERLARLSRTATPRWGAFTAPRMLAHVNDALRSATGELQVAAKPSPLRIFPLNVIVVRWLPFPRNAPTAPELLAREPADWAFETTVFERLLDQVAHKPLDGAWPLHAAFGGLSGADWSLLQWRHIDHHFKQFGG